MKVETPSIAWHNRDRVSSIDFQPKPHPKPTQNGGTRIATGGDDNHVIIWELFTNEQGKIEVKCVCDLSRHQNSVNAVRWSPDGKILASADTDSGIWLWSYSETEAAPDLFGESNEEQNVNTENWTSLSTLRGHLQDVIGLSWSPCSQFVISCSTDSTAIVFDVKKGSKLKMLDDHKGWVNGVAWDPLNKFVATISSDRTLRIYNTKNYKNKSKTHKAALPVEVENKVENPSSQTCIEERNVRLFHDDTFQSFYRRLDFSPDGELLVIPSGVLEIDGETSIKSCTYVFSRENFLKPVLYLPAKDISIAVRFSPIKYELRPIPRTDGIEAVPGQPWTRYQTLFALPYRMIYAIATKNSVVFYDTQQAEPFARVSKIHFVSLNDLSWSADGQSLIVASTDGFCSVIKFNSNEIGTEYCELIDAEESLNDLSMNAEEPMDDSDSDVPVSKDGIPLDKEGVCSPASIKIRSVKEGGKPNPKRLQLITISSPKSKTDQDIDENDLNLILEDTVDHKVTDAADNNADKEDASTSAKKRVPLVTLSKDDTKKRVPLMPADSANGSEKKRVPFVTLSK